MHPQYFAALKEWRALPKLNKAFLKNSGEFERLDLPVSITKINHDDFMSLSMKKRRNFLSSGIDNYLSLAVSAFGWKKNSASEIKAVGDITGANGLVDERFLRFYKTAAESVGLRIKPVYLMRDPVSRHLSAVKMRFANKVLGLETALDNKFSAEKHSIELNRMCLKSLGVGYYDKRVSYHKIVPKIERVFGREEILFCFSENMRDSSSINQFTDFLEIERFKNHSEMSARASNEGSLEYRFPSEVKNKVYQHYSHVYSFVRERFGIEAPNSWAFMNSEN